MSRQTLTLIVPTFRRPEDLLIAVRSVFSQTLFDQLDCTLVIVDNDPEGTAAEAIETLRRECPDTLTFISDHKPRPGVSNARNCAMQYVQSDLIAFLDDDQMVEDPEWLEKLYRLYTELKATVTFGPFQAVLPEGVTEHRDYLHDFFSRKDTSPRGLIEHYHGCCNTLLDVSQLPQERPLFDVAMNETGGEDDILFEQIRERGGTFAWEPDALIYERIPERRAHLGYALRRAMVYGQGPTNMARKNRNYAKVLFWVAVGFAKLGWHGLRAALGFLLKLPNRAMQLDLALRGLGKIMFWKKFGFYGAPALKRSPLPGKDKLSATPGT